jgi:hypothetical protein
MGECRNLNTLQHISSSLLTAELKELRQINPSVLMFDFILGLGQNDAAAKCELVPS